MTEAHRIVWTHTGDEVRAEVACTAGPDEWCRWEPTCACEEFGDLGHDDKGWFHVVDLDEPNEFGDEREVHRHRPAKECLVETWLNNDSSLLIELRMTEGSARWSPYVLAETPIVPVWDGDGYSWKFADVPG